MLNQLSIKLKLLLLVSLSLVFLITIGAMGIKGLLQSEAETGIIYEERMLPSIELAEINANMLEIRSQIFAALQHDPQNKFSSMHDHRVSMHIESISEAKRNIDELIEGIEVHDFGTEGNRLLSEQVGKVRAYINQGVDLSVQALQAGQYQRSNEILLRKVNPLFNDYKPSYEAFHDLLETSSEESYLLTQEHTQAQISLDVTLITICLIILGSSALLTVKAINYGVSVLGEGMKQVSSGDLSIQLDYKAQDEIGRIVQSFNQVTDSFRSILTGFSSATTQLAVASEETSKVAEESTRTIQEQKLQTEQVAAAMNEMAATVNEVANSSSQAADTATQAHNEAESGQQILNQTIQVITELAGDIQDSAKIIRSVAAGSEQIGSILDVIKGIAEQTNLLALNAAIEAARAGEQGRGFAVVADEVRTLASRTQDSTTEIEKMIGALQSNANEAVGSMQLSLEKTQQGVNQTEKMGQALEAIFAAITAMNDMNTQIASASEQQSSVADEINLNVSTINSMAEQNSAGASQVATSSQELARLSDGLQNELARFSI